MAIRSKLWCVAEADLRGLTPARARDLIIECFYDAQRETFARARASLGAGTTEDELRRSVASGVRLAFKEAGHDYDHPTARSLSEVVSVLARKAQSWGTPPDVIEHHRAEIERVLNALTLSQ